MKQEDRKLLELAAKEVGIEFRPATAVKWNGLLLPDGGLYNPLENEAQAFRLAVKLGMVIHFNGTLSISAGETIIERGEDSIGDACRAIVTEAARMANSDF